MTELVVVIVGGLVIFVGIPLWDEWMTRREAREEADRIERAIGGGDE